MEGTAGLSDEQVLRQSAERFWHLSRGLKAAVFLAFVILVFLLFYREVNYDVRLETVLGERIASGGFAGLAETADPGAPAPESPWLWWLVAYGLGGIFGVESIRFFAALLATAGFAVLLVAVSRRAGMVVGALLLVAAAYVARPYMAPGSQAAGIFMFAALAALVASALESPGRRIWWAVGLMVLYVNVDLSWPAGAALAIAGLGALALSKVPRRGEKALALAAALAATLLNPNFASAWPMALMLPAGAGSAAAWLSPVVAPVAAGKAAGYLLLILAALAVFLSMSLAAFILAGAAALTALPGLSVASFPVFTAAAAAAAAMGLAGTAERLCLILPPGARGAVRRYVSPLFAPAGELSEPAATAADNGEYWKDLRAACGLQALLAAGGLVVMLFLAAGSVGGIYRGGQALPEGAVSFIRETGISGRALVQPSWAGYLVLSVHGRVEPVATTRPLAASPEAATLVAWVFGGAAWPAGVEARPADVAAELGATIALVPGEWGRALAFRDGWTPVYWDDTAAVLLADVPANAPIIERYDSSLTYPPYFTLGLSEGNIEEIRHQLTRKIDRQGDLAWAHYELAVLAYMEGKYGRAEGHLNMALAEKQDFAAALHLAGDIYRVRGDDQAAMRFYAGAIEREPLNAMAWLRMGNLLLKNGDWVRGLKALKAAQAADDKRPQLDGVRPGLRGELDEQIEKIISPRPPAPEAEEAGEGAETEKAPETPVEAPLEAPAESPTRAPGGQTPAAQGD